MEELNPIKPLSPIRRSTHIYCGNCEISAENYSQVDCTWCGIKNIKWETLEEINLKNKLQKNK